MFFKPKILFRKTAHNSLLFKPADSSAHYDFFLNPILSSFFTIILIILILALSETRRPVNTDFVDNALITLWGNVIRNICVKSLRRSLTLGFVIRIDNTARRSRFKSGTV